MSRPMRHLRAACCTPLAATLLIATAHAQPSAGGSAGRAPTATPRPRPTMGPTALRSLARAIDRWVEAPPFDRHLWGIAIADEQGHLLYTRNADRLFVPASNTKLVVSAAAAVMLDPDARMRTSLYGNGPVVNGVLKGSLVLYGRGDPTGGRHCYDVDTTRAGQCDTDPFARVSALARQLRESGIRRVEGDLVGDGSWFDAQLVRPDWQGYDLNWWYAAPVSGLGFNDNSVDITWKPGPMPGAPPSVGWSPNLGGLTLENRAVTDTVGTPESIDFFREPGTLALWAQGRVPLDAAGSTEYFALPDPNRWAADALRKALGDEGVTVTGRTRSLLDSTAYAAARARGPLAEVEGRPVRDWIFPVLNTSQNWFAEMLLKTLGRERGGAGSWNAGLAVERRFLIDSVGADSTQFRLSDGSGLSSVNFVSPATFVALLQYMRRHPRFPVFAAGLPRSGAVGSLRKRFVGTALEGKVQAKTGSITGVNSLAGYLTRPDGTTWTFAVMANHHVLAGREMLARIDSIVTTAGTFRP